MKKRLTTHEVQLLLGISKARVTHKLKQGHFPNHARCECGRSVLIPASDLKLKTIDRRRKTSR